LEEGGLSEPKPYIGCSALEEEEEEEVVVGVVVVVVVVAYQADLVLGTLSLYRHLQT
jgi:hypothetical protein